MVLVRVGAGRDRDDVGSVAHRLRELGCDLGLVDRAALGQHPLHLDRGCRREALDDAGHERPVPGVLVDGGRVDLLEVALHVGGQPRSVRVDCCAVVPSGVDDGDANAVACVLVLAPGRDRVAGRGQVGFGGGAKFPDARCHVQNVIGGGDPVAPLADLALVRLPARVGQLALFAELVVELIQNGEDVNGLVADAIRDAVEVEPIHSVVHDLTQPAVGVLPCPEEPVDPLTVVASHQDVAGPVQELRVGIVLVLPPRHLDLPIEGAADDLHLQPHCVAADVTLEAADRWSLWSRQTEDVPDPGQHTS
jgi:hypothetical protein